MDKAIELIKDFTLPPLSLMIMFAIVILVAGYYVSKDNR